LRDVDLLLESSLFGGPSSSEALGDVPDPDAERLISVRRQDVFERPAGRRQHGAWCRQ
jgi:hypothetical protein